ncbi:MAG: sulfite exporter TauE/SafE family protein [Alphaproteobacteria bacterium]|nr:sulfite exporter TauE/SafE family protein [Alphaproteobacteria bacterium]
MLDVFAPLLTGTTAVAVALVAFAGVLRGFSGFGSAMVLAPSLAALYPLTQAVPLVILLEVALSFQLLPGAVRLVVWREIGVMSAAALPGLGIGAWLLTVVPGYTLRLGISALIIVFLALIATRVRRRGAKTAGGLAGAGLLSGVANGASGVGGPPIVLYYLAGDGSSAALRATVICYFFIIDIASAAIFGAQGLLTREVLLLALLCLPASVAGVWLGSRWFDGASEQLYRRVAYGIIAAAALVAPFV